jgi:hypothetical protein
MMKGGSVWPKKSTTSRTGKGGGTLLFSVAGVRLLARTGAINAQFCKKANVFEQNLSFFVGKKLCT